MIQFIAAKQIFIKVYKYPTNRFWFSFPNIVDTYLDFVQLCEHLSITGFGSTRLATIERTACPTALCLKDSSLLKLLNIDTYQIFTIRKHIFYSCLPLSSLFSFEWKKTVGNEVLIYFSSKHRLH